MRALGLCSLAASALLLWTPAARAQSGGPQIASGGVVNAADYSTALAPGALVAIYGSGLASGSASAASLPLPVTLLDQVSVEVTDGATTAAAPLWFVSPGQINAQLPFNLQGKSVQVRVRNARGASNAVTITLTARAPRLFTKAMDGKGEALVYHADYTPVSASSPARPGEAVFCYVNGLGATEPAMTAGRPGGDNAGLGEVNVVGESVGVLINGQAAKVLFAGMAPGFVVYQVNFLMPDVPSADAASIRVDVAGLLSQETAVVAYRSDWKAVGSGQVGSGGGSVSAPGITVAVNAGAMASPGTVAVYQAPSAQAGSLSGTYVLTGLPSAPKAPVQITLELTSTPPSDASALRLMLTSRGAGGSMLKTYPGTLQGGRFTAVVGATGATTGGDKAVRAAVGDVPPSLEPIQASVIDAGFLVSDSGKFRIVTPSGLASPAMVQSATHVLAALDKTYGLLEGPVGLSWTQRTAWPFEVYLYPFNTWLKNALGWENADWWGYLNPATYNYNNFTLALNSAKCAPPSMSGETLATVRATAAHELFHFMQALYDRRSGPPPHPGSWYWFNEAASTWIEDQVAGEPGYVPYTLKPRSNAGGVDASDNYAFFMKNGLEFTGSDASTQNHGYGAAMFLKHLSTRFGNEIIGGILALKSKVHLDGYTVVFDHTPVGAIDTALRSYGSSVSEEWRRFAESFMAGTVYPKFPSSQEILGVRGKREYKTTLYSNPPGPATFTWSAPDLSGQLFLVSLAYQLPVGTDVVISLSDPGKGASAVVYQTGRNNLWKRLGVIAPGETSLRIPSASSVFQTNDGLAILVANGHAVAPYDGVTNLLVEVSLGASILPSLQKMTWAEIDTLYDCNAMCKSSSGSTSRCFPMAVPKERFTPVVWNGPTFTAKGNAAPGEHAVTATLTGRLDGLGKVLTDGSLVSSMRWTDSNDGQCEAVASVSYKDLPVGPYRDADKTMYWFSRSAGDSYQARDNAPPGRLESYSIRCSKGYTLEAINLPAACTANRITMYAVPPR